MAVSTDSKILHSDIINWYTIFNNISTNYSNGLTNLSAPIEGAQISTNQIEQLSNQINNFRSDYYLSTQLDWFPVQEVPVKGSTIVPSQVNSIQTVVGNYNKIKCRNIATNSSGTHSSGTKSNGNNSVSCTSGKNSNGTCGSGTKSCGVHREDGNGKVYNGNGTHSCGKNSKSNCVKGTKTSGVLSCGANNNVAKDNTTTIDITCQHSTKVNG